MPEIAEMEPKTLSPRAKFRGGIARGLAAGAVDREAKCIKGFAVISRGEALGHGLWIDAEMLDAVVRSGNAAKNGLKQRFTHPGLCADGLGSFLGRCKNFRRDGDTVRADMFLSDVAAKSPDGNLADYVMDLAEEDAEAFGTSIVFERDWDAEALYMRENGGSATGEYWGRPLDGFASPDPENVECYPHARLKKLFACDVVDEPAANAGGFFSAGDELASRAEAVLAFLTGTTERVPSGMELGGMDAQKARDAFKGFLSRHGLRLSKETAIMADEKKPVEVPADQAAALRADGGKAERERFAALKAKFGARPEFVQEQFEKGATVEQAEIAFKDLRLAELERENETLKKGGGEAQTPAKGAQPVSFSGEVTGAGGGGDDFVSASKAYAAEHNVSLSKAMDVVRKTQPELHKKFTAAHQPAGKK